MQEGVAVSRFTSTPLGKSFRRGDKVTASSDYMDHLIGIGVIDPRSVRDVNQKPVGPSEQKPAGPSEQKAPDPHKKLLERAGRFAYVERAWLGRTVVILGGGPSLTQGDGLERIKASHDRAGLPLSIIAVNNAYQVAPHAEVLYAADGRWWTWHAEQLKAFAGLKLQSDVAAGEGLAEDGYIIRVNSRLVLSRDPAQLASGGNSGYQAINLAALAGAQRIVLLGFDMKRTDGRANWHAGHKITPPPRKLAEWIPRFRELAAELRREGIHVMNASEETALDAFERRPIAELIDLPSEEKA